MALQVPIIYENQMQRKLSPGDTVASFEPIPGAADTTNTALSLTPAMLLASTYVRNPAGVSTDTFPTADALITALQSNFPVSPLQAGMSFRFRVINLSANLITGAVTANTGVTMTRGNVPASSTKDFLVSITSGAPAVTASNLVTVNGSAVVSGFTSTVLASLAVGQQMTTSTANLQGQTILGINFTAGTVTLSGNANASQVQTMTFVPTYTVTGLSA